MPTYLTHVPPVALSEHLAPFPSPFENKMEKKRKVLSVTVCCVLDFFFPPQPYTWVCLRSSWASNHPQDVGEEMNQGDTDLQEKVRLHWTRLISAIITSVQAAEESSDASCGPVRARAVQHFHGCVTLSHEAARSFYCSCVRNCPRSTRGCARGSWRMNP